MGLHQIRYEVDLLVYDTVWNTIAVLLLAAGLILIYRTRAAVPPNLAERAANADA